MKTSVFAAVLNTNTIIDRGRRATCEGSDSHPSVLV